MGLACHVFNGKLCEECPLAVVERQFVLRNNINEVRADIQGGAEKMGVGFEVLIATRVLITV